MLWPAKETDHMTNAYRETNRGILAHNFHSSSNQIKKGIYSIVFSLLFYSIFSEENTVNMKDKILPSRAYILNGKDKEIDENF